MVTVVVTVGGSYLRYCGVSAARRGSRIGSSVVTESRSEDRLSNERDGDQTAVRLLRLPNAGAARTSWGSLMKFVTAFGGGRNETGDCDEEG